MNKKLLVWFCGTSTTKEQMQDQFKGCIPHEEDTLFIDGLGTAANNKEAKEMLKPAFWEWSNTSKDEIMGYMEKHQEVQEYQLIPFLDRFLDDKQVQGIDLVIGGHSRGAAAGMIGFLSNLCALAQYEKEQSPFFKKIRKITLIPVDPVAGTFGNDLLQDGDTPVATILDTIQTIAGNKELFDIISFNARFEARSPFALDNNWGRFFEGIHHNKTSFDRNRVRFFVAGFRHSAMVDAGEEISLLYPVKNKVVFSPTTLLRYIVASCLQEDDYSQRIEAIAEVIRKTEVAAIAALLGEQPGSKILADRTTCLSYHPPLPGTSLTSLLKDILQKKQSLFYKGRMVLTEQEWDGLG